MECVCKYEHLKKIKHSSIYFKVAIKCIGKRLDSSLPQYNTHSIAIRIRVHPFHSYTCHPPTHHPTRTVLVPQRIYNHRIQLGLG